MTTFLIAFGVFTLALAGMAVGVLISNRSIKGSCGGLNNFRDSSGKPICEACTNPSPECRGNPSDRHESAAVAD